MSVSCEKATFISPSRYRYLDGEPALGRHQAALQHSLPETILV